MALPLMVLYEISIIGARVFGKKKAEEVDEDLEEGEEIASQKDTKTKEE